MANGKHVAQNHPKVDNTNKRVAILASTVLVAVLSVYASSKFDIAPVDNSGKDNISYANTNVQDISVNLNGLKTQYTIQDQYGLTFEGLVFDYFESQLNGLDNNGKLATMRNMLNDQDLDTKIYNYVMSKTNVKEIEFADSLKEEAQSNISIVRNDEPLMTLINKYCELYGEDVNKIVALIAHNMTNGIINTNNLIGANVSWFSLDASRSVTNLNKEEINLKTFFNNHNRGLESYVLYNVLISQSCNKEANGNPVNALNYVFNGPYFMGNDEEKIDEVITYMMLDSSSESVTIKYSYVDSNGNATERIQRVQTKDYTSNIINQIITQLNVSITNTYGKALN